MHYFQSDWFHSLSSEPIKIYAELGDDRYVIRMIEQFSDGRFGFADETKSSGGTRFPIAPIPTLDEINQDTQFLAKPMTSEDFDELWRRVTVISMTNEIIHRS